MTFLVANVHGCFHLQRKTLTIDNGLMHKALPYEVE